MIFVLRSTYEDVKRRYAASRQLIADLESSRRLSHDEYKILKSAHQDMRDRYADATRRVVGLESSLQDLRAEVDVHRKRADALEAAIGRASAALDGGNNQEELQP